VNDLSDAFGDFVARGFKDFKGFTRSVLGSFQKMLADMISTALRNRIMIGVGLSGSVAGSAAAGVAGGGGGLLSGLLGSFGSKGGFLGGAGLGGGTGLLGGLGNALSGGLGGVFKIGANAAAAGGGIMAGLGAAVPIIGGVGLLLSALKKKVTTTLDVIGSGTVGTLRLKNSSASDYRDMRETTTTSRFWGLSKKTTSREWQETFANAGLTSALNDIISEAADGVLSLGAGIGSKIAEADLAKIVRRFSAAQGDQSAIDAEVGKLTDDYAALVLGGWETVTTQTGRRVGGFFESGLSRGLDRVGGRMVGLFSRSLSRAAGGAARTTTRISEKWKEFARDGETASQVLTRVSTSLQVANPIMEQIALTMFEVSAAGGNAASVFADLLGGIDGLKSITASYYAEFFTDSERAAFTTSKLTAAFADLGLALPGTRDAFRGLVEAADAAGNRDLVASLLKLSPAFSTISEAAEDTVSRINQALADLKPEDFATALDFNRARGLLAFGPAAAVSPALAAAPAAAQAAQTQAQVDRHDALLTTMNTNVAMIWRLMQRQDIEGLPPVRT